MAVTMAGPIGDKGSFAIYIDIYIYIIYLMMRIVYLLGLA